MEESKVKQFKLFKAHETDQMIDQFFKGRGGQKCSLDRNAKVQTIDFESWRSYQSLNIEKLSMA